MAKEIHLQHIEINSFKGISSDDPVILDLGKSYSKGKNITIFTGDQGVHKTSSMEGIMYLLGHNFPWTKDNLINSKDKTISELGKITIDGEEYRIRVTKNTFEFEKYITDLKKWVGVGEPKSTLQKLIGPLGISPMFLKEYSGAQQISWFREQFGADETLEKKEANLKTKLGKIKEDRKETNKKADLLRKSLVSDPIYRDIETYAEKFKEPKSVEGAKAKLEAVQLKKNQYDNSVRYIADVDTKIKTIEEEIIELELKLQAKKNTLEETKANKQKGQKWLDENTTIPTDYQTAYDEFLNISKEVAEQDQYNQVTEKVKQLETYETEVQEYEAEKDKTVLKLLEITKKYLPEIEGLEIKVDKGLDKDKNEEGVYFQKKTLAQLSESELWDLYMQICDKKQIRFVFIENINGLGSHAQDTINQLSKNGVKVFASLMNKNLKTLKFKMTDSIDL